MTTKHHPKLIFDEMEHEVIYYTAAIALADATIFDEIAAAHDINDDCLAELRDKLYKYLQGVE